ncbi:MAG: hypothetical protein MZU97_06145 [Bacillus subtilis]|nr:hypothetical protein [Bacillus subtilis]
MASTKDDLIDSFYLVSGSPSQLEKIQSKLVSYKSNTLRIYRTHRFQRRQLLLKAIHHQKTNARRSSSSIIPPTEVSIMRNLMKKEFLINLHPIYSSIPLCAGLLMFIPQWIYTVAFLYYFWISVPNLFGSLQPATRSHLHADASGEKKRHRYLPHRRQLAFATACTWSFGNRVWDLAQCRLWNLQLHDGHQSRVLTESCFLIFAGFNLIFFPMYFQNRISHTARACFVDPSTRWRSRLERIC